MVRIEELAAATEQAEEAVEHLKEGRPGGVKILEKLDDSLHKLFTCSYHDADVQAVVFAAVVGQYWENDKGAWLSKSDKRRLMWKEMMRGRTAVELQRFEEAKAWARAFAAKATALAHLKHVRDSTGAMSVVDKELKYIVPQLRKWPEQYGRAAIVELLITKTKILRASRPMSDELVAEIAAVCARIKHYDGRHPFLFLQLGEVDLHRGLHDRAAVHAKVGLEYAMDGKPCDDDNIHMLLLQLQERAQQGRNKDHGCKKDPKAGPFEEAVSAAAQQRLQGGTRGSQQYADPPPCAEESAASKDCGARQADRSVPGSSSGPTSGAEAPLSGLYDVSGAEVARPEDLAWPGKETSRDAAVPVLADPLLGTGTDLLQGSGQGLKPNTALAKGLPSISKQKRTKVPEKRRKAHSQDPGASEEEHGAACEAGIELDKSNAGTEDRQDVRSHSNIAKQPSVTRGGLVHEGQLKLGGGVYYFSDLKPSFQAEAAFSSNSQAPSTPMSEGKCPPFGYAALQDTAANPSTDCTSQPGHSPAKKLGGIDAGSYPRTAFPPLPLVGGSDEPTGEPATFEDVSPFLEHLPHTISTPIKTQGNRQYETSRSDAKWSYASGPAWRAGSPVLGGIAFARLPYQQPGHESFEKELAAESIPLEDMTKNLTRLPTAQPEQSQQASINWLEQDASVETLLDLLSTGTHSSAQRSFLSQVHQLSTHDIANQITEPKHGSPSLDASKTNPSQEALLCGMQSQMPEGMAVQPANEPSGSHFEQNSAPMASWDKYVPWCEARQDPSCTHNPQQQLEDSAAIRILSTEQAFCSQEAALRASAASAPNTSPPPLQAEHCRAEGNKAFKEGRYRHALQMFFVARKEEPNNAIHAINMAAALVKTGRYKIAELVTESVLNMKDADISLQGDARWWRAQAYLGMAGLQHLLKPPRGLPSMAAPPRLGQLRPSMSPEQHSTHVMHARQNLVAALHILGGRSCRKQLRIYDLLERVSRLPATVREQSAAMWRRGQVLQSDEHESQTA